jgi:transposase
MRQTSKSHGEKIVKDIKRATRRQYSLEEKIRIVLDVLRGEESIAGLCRREGIAESLYYSWSKEFLEGAKLGKVKMKGAILCNTTMPDGSVIHSGC